MKILKVIVDEVPCCCCDCTEIALRSQCRDDENPQICGLTEIEISETEGRRPKTCPLVKAE